MEAQTANTAKSILSVSYLQNNQKEKTKGKREFFLIPAPAYPTGNTPVIKSASGAVS